MQILVNDVCLFVDVVSSGLVVDGNKMTTRPTLIFLHGGPGFDHSGLKPEYNRLGEYSQLVFYDHRGHGRSSKDVPSNWTLDQWADDLYELIKVLGIEKPIVFGHSFGGIVAQNYAIRHPDKLYKLCLIATIARMVPSRIYKKFYSIGGAIARDVAQAFWDKPSQSTLPDYVKHCLPLYSRVRSDHSKQKRTIMTLDVLTHFTKTTGEVWSFDFRNKLSVIKSPTLLIAGDLDPITPLESVMEIHDALDSSIVTFELFKNCSHSVHRDDPAFFDVVKKFVVDEI